MTAFLLYILRGGLYLGLFYAFYTLVMRRTTFFRFNRVALLAGSLACAILPLLKVRTAPVTTAAGPLTMTAVQEQADADSASTASYMLTVLSASGSGSDGDPLTFASTGDPSSDDDIRRRPAAVGRHRHRCPGRGHSFLHVREDGLHRPERPGGESGHLPARGHACKVPPLSGPFPFPRLPDCLVVESAGLDSTHRTGPPARIRGRRRRYQSRHRCNTISTSSCAESRG